MCTYDRSCKSYKRVRSSLVYEYVYFCKQKTAYEMRISDWSSDVCSSDLRVSSGRPMPKTSTRATSSADRFRASMEIQLASYHFSPSPTASAATNLRAETATTSPRP